MAYGRAALAADLGVLRTHGGETSVKSWRILTDGDGGATEPLTAEAIAQRLWACEEDSLWAEPADGADGSDGEFPQDVPDVRAVLLADPRRVAEAFLEHSSLPDWLFLWVMNLCESHPEETWTVILALVQAAQGSKELAYVGAAPLEKLLYHHGARVIEVVESEAARSPAFRRALSAVWSPDIPPVVWERIVQAVGSDPELDE